MTGGCPIICSGSPTRTIRSGASTRVEAYGPDPKPELKLEPVDTSHEWYRPNPPPPVISWGPRNSVNIQESGLLFALNRVATDRELYLENYWVKNRQSIESGRTGAVNAWVIPAAQHSPGNVVEMVNDLRRQGVEVSRADAAFRRGRRAGRGGRLRHSCRPALSNAGRHVFRGAELPGH